MEKLNNTETKADGRNETGWEDVAVEAERMDWAELKVAQKVAEAQEDFEVKRAQLGEIRDRIANLAKPSGKFTDGGNLDAREISHDTTRLEQKANNLRAEVAEARKQYEKLSTEEERKAEAERLRKEAKEYNKFFTRGLMVVGTGRMEEFDSQILAARDPEVKKQLEAAREEYIRNTVIPTGKGSVEMAKDSGTGKDESLENVGEPDNENDLKKEVMDREVQTDKDKARVFAEKIDERSLRQSTSIEKIALGKILRRIGKYDSNQSKPSAFERRQHKKDLQELTRYGYNPGGKNSRLFDSIAELIRDETALGTKDAKEIGKERAENWKLVDIVANGKSGRKFRKELKKSGFPRLPESWDDENYTSNEMNRMAFVAKSYLAMTPNI